VIHRNLKPSKVMIGADGVVHVLGWGLARVVTENELPVTSGTQSIVGTPAYMSPEQARGEVADSRADVFGLGGLLCFILTGEPTFTGRTVRDLLQRSAAGDLTGTFARLDACGADPKLIALAKRCLSPNPADRPTGAEEVAEAVACEGRPRISTSEPRFP
jgi:serine/threonine protein kinase